MPCGHTLAAVCPSCAERARALRAAQCREGWHLEHEPVTDPDPATEDQRWWIQTRADAQALRDQAASDGQDTSDLDELVTELDDEITAAGMRGNVLPARPARRHRSTKRRQDAPDLPRRKVTSRTVGKTYTAPDGKTFRPSMFLTLTCPSPTGGSATTAPPPTPAPTTTPGRRGTRCTSRRCSTGSSRTCAGSSAMTCSTSPPSNHNGGSPRTSTSRCAAPCPAPSCAGCWPPPITRCGGPTPPRSGSTGTSGRCGTSRRVRMSIRTPGKSCPPGTRPSTPSGTRTSRVHVARFGDRFDAQGVLSGSKDANRCIGYLTKYLTKQVADCHQAADRRRTRARRPAGRGAAVRAVLAAVRQLAPLRHPAQERPARPGPRRLQGQGPRPAITSATPGAASWPRASGRARRWPTTAPTGRTG